MFCFLTVEGGKEKAAALAKKYHNLDKEEPSSSTTLLWATTFGIPVEKSMRASTLELMSLTTADILDATFFVSTFPSEASMQLTPRPCFTPNPHGQPQADLGFRTPRQAHTSSRLILPKSAAPQSQVQSITAPSKVQQLQAPFYDFSNVPAPVVIHTSPTEASSDVMEGLGLTC